MFCGKWRWSECKGKVGAGAKLLVTRQAPLAPTGWRGSYPIAGACWQQIYRHDGQGGCFERLETGWKLVRKFQVSRSFSGCFGVQETTSFLGASQLCLDIGNRSGGSLEGKSRVNESETGIKHCVSGQCSLFPARFLAISPLWKHPGPFLVSGNAVKTQRKHHVSPTTNHPGNS